MSAFPLTRLLDRSSAMFLILLAAFAMVIPTLNLLVLASSGLHVSTYLVALFGKYICYAMLALSIDLIWGYAGILSLGHGAFFALGGYARSFDPAQNVRGGALYLSRLAERFGENEVEKVLAAYNAGPERVDAWTALRGELPPEEFIESIPFTETRNYVQRVMENLQVYSALFGSSIATEPNLYRETRIERRAKPASLVQSIPQ